MSLSREEIAKAKFTFSIYDFEGINKIDACQLGNALRALNLTPSLKRISTLGGTRTRNEKMLTVEEFLAIYQEAKNDKKEGCLEDYMEVLSSQDKDRCGKLAVATLGNMLQSYGEEKLDRDEAEEVIEECGDPYDGLVDYEDFLRNLLRGPEIKIPISMLYATERTYSTNAEAAADDSNVEMNIENTDTLKEPGNIQQTTNYEDLATATFTVERRSSKKASQPNEDELSDVSVEFSLNSKLRSLAMSRSSKDNNATSAGINDTEFEGDSSASSSTTPVKRTVKKSKSRSGANQDASDASASSDATASPETSVGEVLGGARNQLKSKSSRPVSDNPPKKPPKLKGESSPPPVKAKHQQALISLKTQGLIGK